MLLCSTSMLVSELCTREVVVADRDATIFDAAKLMRAFHVGDLVVVEDRHGVKHPVGMVTERDLVVNILAEEVERVAELSVEDVMSRELITAQETADVTEVMKTMRAHGVRRLPVVGPRGELVGMISFDDLLEHVASELGDLAQLLVREHTQERKLRDVAIGGMTGTRH